MNRKWKFFFAGVLLLALGLGLLHRLRARAAAEPQRKVIRLGHYMLSDGVRRALQAVIADYERRRPDVKVVETPIPERIYLQFLRSQLVGRTAPDILQIGFQFTGFDELRDRYFFPITPHVSRPNPYNVGTALEHTPWRDTFIDGLNGVEAYSSAQRQYYGVPTVIGMLRGYYNRDLLREITGGERVPGNYTEFMALCQQVEDYAHRTGRSISTLAGSRLDAFFLMNQFFSSVNQRLYYELDENHSLLLNWWDYPKAYLRGKWDYKRPTIRMGYEMMREIGRYMRPGFQQLDMSSAHFQFMQGQAVFTVASVRDSMVLRDQAPFPVSVHRLPLVTPTDPHYGREVLGPVSEAANESSMTFGVVEQSAHRDIAVDFLRFLGSYPASELFSRATGWVPMVEGVPVPAAATPFKPVLEGYSGRFFAEMNGMGEGRMVVARGIHILFEPDGGVDAYCDYLTREYPDAMVWDLKKEVVNGTLNLRRQEPVITALRALAASAEGADAPEKQAEAAHLVTGQNYHETRLWQTRYRVKEYENRRQDHLPARP